MHICILSKALAGAPEQMVFGELSPTNFIEISIFACNSAKIWYFQNVIFFENSSDLLWGLIALVIQKNV